MRRYASLIALSFAAVVVLSPAWAANEVRNPFNVADVNDPDGDDVKQFAKDVTLAGDKDDKNAEQWVENETEGKADSLDGDWSGRWDGASGTAKIKATKDRVFILYTDVVNGVEGSTWLIEAVKVGKTDLRGRWVDITDANASGVFAGKIVDNERIDGAWTAEARWDFRRKLKAKKD